MKIILFFIASLLILIGIYSWYGGYRTCSWNKIAIADIENGTYHYYYSGKYYSSNMIIWGDQLHMYNYFNPINRSIRYKYVFVDSENPANSVLICGPYTFLSISIIFSGLIILIVLFFIKSILRIIGNQKHYLPTSDDWGGG